MALSARVPAPTTPTRLLNAVGPRETPRRIACARATSSASWCFTEISAVQAVTIELLASRKALAAGQLDDAAVEVAQDRRVLICSRSASHGVTG